MRITLIIIFYLEYIISTPVKISLNLIEMKFLNIKDTFDSNLIKKKKIKKIYMESLRLMIDGIKAGIRVVKCPEFMTTK